MPTIDNNNRNTRKSLEITTMIGCPVLCTYCPQDTLLTNYKDPVRRLTLENFKLILDKLPLDVQISFAGYSEPWANNLCNQFVKLALARGYYISIFTTLYPMTVAQAEKLANLLEQYSEQIIRVWIHLPDINNNMPGFRYSDEYEQVLRTIKSVSNKVLIREMTMDSESRVDARIVIPVNPQKDWHSNNRADNLNLSNIKGQKINIAPRHKCPVECVRTKHYHDNVLLPNGDVTLCTMDYGLKHIIGNLLTQSYEEILNGEPLQEIVALNQQEGFSNSTLCRTCTDAFCSKDAAHYTHPDPNRKIKLT